MENKYCRFKTRRSKYVDRYCYPERNWITLEFRLKLKYLIINMNRIYEDNSRIEFHVFLAQEIINLIFNATNKVILKGIP